MKKTEQFIENNYEMLLQYAYKKTKFRTTPLQEEFILRCIQGSNFKKYDNNFFYIGEYVFSPYSNIVFLVRGNLFTSLYFKGFKIKLENILSE